MLDVLRQALIKWGTSVMDAGRDVTLDIGQDMFVWLHVDGEMKTIVMLQCSVIDDDDEYICPDDNICYAHFLLDPANQRFDDWIGGFPDCRAPSEDEQASAFLKLLAAMA